MGWQCVNGSRHKLLMLIEMEKIKGKKKIIDDFVFVKVFIITRNTLKHDTVNGSKTWNQQNGLSYIAFNTLAVVRKCNSLVTKGGPGNRSFRQFSPFKGWPNFYVVFHQLRMEKWKAKKAWGAVFIYLFTFFFFKKKSFKRTFF